MSPQSKISNLQGSVRGEVVVAQAGASAEPWVCSPVRLPLPVRWERVVRGVA